MDESHIDFQPFVGHEVVLFFNSGSSISGVLVEISHGGKMLVLRHRTHNRHPDTWEKPLGVQLAKAEIHILASAIVGYYLKGDMPLSVASPYQAAQI